MKLIDDELVGVDVSVRGLCRVFDVGRVGDVRGVAVLDLFWVVGGPAESGGGHSDRGEDGKDRPGDRVADFGGDPSCDGVGE